MKVLLLVAAAIAAVALFVRWVEPRLAFFPSRGETATPEAYGVPFTAHSVETADGATLRVWRLGDAASVASRTLVVYFHGNGGNLSVWTPILAGIARRGYDVVAFDYRGYGLSTGRPTERGLYRDADAVLAFVSMLAPRPARVIYWGRSLGSAVAAYAAAQQRVQRPDGVIVEAGFPDARSLFAAPPLSWLARLSTYRFRTAAFLNQARTPVLVLHGDRDSVVPYSLGRALFEQIAAPKRFVAIRDGDHNDLHPGDANAYWTAIESFIASLRDPARR